MAFNSYEYLHCCQNVGALDFIQRVDAIIGAKFPRSQRHVVRHTIGTVYGLELEGGHYYVGFAQDLEHRLAKHINGKRAYWTQRYNPISLVDLCYDLPELVEERMSRLYIERYGFDMVRGGRHLDARDERPGYEMYPRYSSYVQRP